jgi:hypothetical protein
LVPLPATRAESIHHDHTHFIGQTRVGERVGDPHEDRVNRARADPGAEQLLAALHDIATRHSVAH